MARLRRTRGPKQIANAWRKYTEFIFSKNGMVEAQIRQAGLGRYIKDEILPPGALRDWDKAVEDAAQGSRGTDAQVAAGRWLDRAYGKYDKWGPDMKRLIGWYTPFIAWQFNAIKFLTLVPPRDHPVLTGLLAANHQATEEWRKKMGLGLFIEVLSPDSCRA